MVLHTNELEINSSNYANRFTTSTTQRCDREERNISVVTKTMLKLCSSDANWSEMVFHRDFCGSTTRLTSRYDGAGCCAAAVRSTQFTHEQLARIRDPMPRQRCERRRRWRQHPSAAMHFQLSRVGVRESEHQCAGNRTDTVSAVRFACVRSLEYIVISSTDSCHFSAMESWRMRAVALGIFFLCYVRTCMCGCVLCCFLRIHATDDDVNDDDEYLNWTIREWFLLCDRRKRISCAGRENAFASTLHSMKWTYNNNSNK